jgi:hypothetical protein
MMRIAPMSPLVEMYPGGIAVAADQRAANGDAGDAAVVVADLTAPQVPGDPHHAMPSLAVMSASMTDPPTVTLPITLVAIS